MILVEDAELEQVAHDRCYDFNAGDTPGRGGEAPAGGVAVY
jgi:hypothetical protein